MTDASEAATQFANSTLGRDGEAWVLSMHGEHDLATAPELEERMQHLHDSGTSVVIDLTDTTFIDSSIVQWLLRWSQRAAATLHVAVAVPEDSFATRVLDLVEARRRISCHSSVADALRAVRAEESAGAGGIPHGALRRRA